MAKNIDLIRIYGDEAGGVWVAPVGTTPPTGLAAPGAGWEEVGWISEDGIDENTDQSSDVFRAWQGAKIVKRKITQNDRTFKFHALEENKVVQGLRYRGQTAVVADGVATTTVRDQTKADARAWLLDMLDGGVHKRYLIPSGEHSHTGTIQHRNAGMTVFEFEITPLGDYFELTNNPALIA